MNGAMILIRGLCKISFMESSWASIIARNRSNQPSLITIYYGFCIPFDARFLIKKVLDEVRKTRLDRKGTIKKRERKYHCYETDERKRTRLSCPRFLIMRKRKGGRKKKRRMMII